MSFCIFLYIDHLEEANVQVVQVDIEEEKSPPPLQMKTLKPKFVPPIIRFDVLVDEWKKAPNTKGTQTKRPVKKQIKDIFFFGWFKPFLIKLALFINSTYDVTSDGILADSFIEGTIYTKYVGNEFDPGTFIYTFSSSFSSSFKFLSTRCLWADM